MLIYLKEGLWTNYAAPFSHHVAKRINTISHLLQRHRAKLHIWQRKFTTKNLELWWKSWIFVAIRGFSSQIFVSRAAIWPCAIELDTSIMITRPSFLLLLEACKIVKIGGIGSREPVMSFIPIYASVRTVRIKKWKYVRIGDWKQVCYRVAVTSRRISERK